ncbi:MAG TPA: chemotaxis response regulator protein-glutamate methylesterase, partial [Clostridiales bacterium]|nr:chemotaxis response regulator protein-glutamate methylesterase [Clostridiales bacterium]
MVIKDNYQTIVAIGTSTGGPKALQKLLLSLPKDLLATYLIVQHMPAGFTKTLAERMNATADIDVKEAEEGDVLQQGM